ncbi:MAG: 1-aminocyclopropane-1-carboxylate deaminase/D-cysteine desulfhydrase [Alcanivoracaceae bacterium]|nr:1-aminocyclopropane-1-carboxylate deaminase/D-cysteine desulfhydrase [Alcanivoracaceae bacterium]
MKKPSKWQRLFCQKTTTVGQLARYKGVNISIKRDDLNHKIIQGNKLRKLKYNIEYALKNNYTSIATFGGAWSNHVIATAAAAHLCHLSSIGFIRGHELKDNPHKWSQTLAQAQQYGMQLIFLSRLEYKKKYQAQSVKNHIAKLPSAPYLIPEGGSNQLAIKGVADIIVELNQQVNEPTHILTACGTGGTLAGLIDGVAKASWQTTVIGIPVLKGGEYLQQEIETLSTYHHKVKWQLYCAYHAGGYAKTSKVVLDFAKKFSHDTQIPLDRVYTSKSFYAAYDLIDRGEITPGSHLIILHTGGLQGGVTA